MNTMDSKKRMLAALEHHKGVVTYAAQDAQIPRSTHYLWLESDADYKKAVEEIKNVGLDFAERQLFRKMEGVFKETNDGDIYKTEPDTTAIIFYLKTQGKKRGYTEKEETPTDQTINLTIQTIDAPSGD